MRNNEEVLAAEWMYACNCEYMCILEMLGTLSPPYCSAQETEMMNELLSRIEVACSPDSQAYPGSCNTM